MCGRYRRTTSEEELARRYHIPIPRQRDLPISWNIAPSQDVLAIRYNNETKQRSLDALRWGLIPYWAKDPKSAYKTINARVETVDTAPSYRQAFKKRRCLIPVASFYEWKKVVGGKIPYAIGMPQILRSFFQLLIVAQIDGRLGDEGNCGGDHWTSMLRTQEVAGSKPVSRTTVSSAEKTSNDLK